MFQQFDFAHFRTTDADARAVFCRDLVASLREHGFVKLVNHDVPPAAIDAAFEASRHFFHLPLEEKMKSPHPPTPNPHRGYSAFGVEKVAVGAMYMATAPTPHLRDMKESYDIGSERDALWRNIWPPPGVQDGFQPTFTSFFSACYRAELEILAALSIGLGLPEDTLGGMHVDESNELRLTLYPAARRSDFATATRIAAHTDFGTVTLLFQDGIGGLQVESPCGSNNYVDIESGGHYECILNVGDCLQKWTGLHSARHRVHLPAQNGADDDDTVAERFSIAYFAKPDRGALLRPLLPGEDRNGHEPYMTAGEFQAMRIKGTY